MSDVEIKGQNGASDGLPAAEEAPKAVVSADDAKSPEGKESATAAAEPPKETEEGKPSAPKAGESASNILRTSGRKDRGNFKVNNKFDPSTLPDTDDPVQIRQQVEFYFSDSNLPKDKYMWQMTDGEKNKPMPLKTICGFKRMHRFKPYSAVVAALRDSEFLAVSGKEGEEEIQRKEAYSPSTRDEAKELAATVYVKGFGDEQPSTVFDIEAWFVKYGPVNSIRLRRTTDKYFKGSVFVEFPSEEQAQHFLSLDPAPKWQGHDLLIMSKKAYLDGKDKETSRKPFQKGGRGRGRDSHGSRGRHRDDVDPNDWKKRRELDQKNGFRNQRGGRGGGRHDRRDDGREKQESTVAAEKEVDSKAEKSDDVVAKKENGSGDGETAAGKRAREEDTNVDERPVKKVDTKEATAA